MPSPYDLDVGQIYPDLDVVLLDETLEFVRTHMDRWYQGAWAMPRPTPFFDSPLPDNLQAIQGVCGSTLCYFGWAATLRGWEPAFDLDLQIADGSTPYCRKGDGPVVELYEEVGKRLLGLTDHEAGLLFDSANEFRDLEGIIERIKDGYYRTGEYDDPSEEHDVGAPPF